MYLRKGLDREEKKYAYILSWLLLPRRYLRDRLTTEDLYLLNAIQSRIPTNWVMVFKKHMIDTRINNENNLPYGVFISKMLTLHQVVLTRETKVICNKTNEIQKAILTCIGMKKTADDWVFRDVQTQTRNEAEMSDSDDKSVSFTPRYEFERFVMSRFRRTYGKAGMLKKSMFRMEKKMDKLIKNYVDNSSLIERSHEDDESIEEDSMDESESE